MKFLSFIVILVIAGLVSGSFDSIAAVTVTPLSSSLSAADVIPLHINVVGNVTVSGFDSGAFMAVQFHVAHSSTVAGAASIAGGPYWCAQGSMTIAISACMKFPFTIPMSSIIDHTKRSHDLDPLTELSLDSVVILAGWRDTIVLPQVSEKLAEFYSEFVPLERIYTNYTATLAHGLSTVSYGGACDSQFAPYLVHCGFDAGSQVISLFFDPQSKHAVKHTGYSLERNGKESESESESNDDHAKTVRGDGQLVSIQQHSIVGEALAAKAFLDTTGYLYVPSQCQSGRSRTGRRSSGGKQNTLRGNGVDTTVIDHGVSHDDSESSDSDAIGCPLHVVFHGCQQGNSLVGDKFALNSGYQAGADRFGVILLFPQVIESPTLNPNGCWDWWGYTGSTNYATRLGPQILAVQEMIDYLTA